jgi:predicted small lipoprotein YifL
MKSNYLMLAATCLLLQGCGLKGDLYLEEDPNATVAEQEQAEFLEESVERQTEEIESQQDGMDDDYEAIVDDSEREMMETETEGALNQPAPETPDVPEAPEDATEEILSAPEQEVLQDNAGESPNAP